MIKKHEIGLEEIKGIRIGQAENTVAGTGCTVFFLYHGMAAGLDVRGGGPASRESELLNPLATAQVIHGIVLAGGSAFGLNAVAHVESQSMDSNAAVFFEFVAQFLQTIRPAGGNNQIISGFAQNAGRRFSDS